MRNRGYATLVIPVVIALVGAVALSLGLFLGAPAFGKGVAHYVKVVEEVVHVVEERPDITHVSIPDSVRAVYMSQCAASSQTFREEIVSLVEETEINALVIDIKDFTGTVSFNRTSENTVILTGAGCVVPDMKEFIDYLHTKDIYVIGRITVFQDPLYTSVYPEQAVQSRSSGTPWKDYKGLSFVDVGAKPFWDYIVNISREATALGFDELNFDYIRYPSDGPMSDVLFNHSDYTQRPVELERFFRYLEQKVRRPDPVGYSPVLSADLFGMTTTNKDDLTIGQVMERATPYFDYIAPMTYPSHYPQGFNGYADPNKNVYGVIRYSMDRAIPRIESATTTIAALAYEPIGTTTLYRKPARDRSLLRPWLQDFDYGGIYGPQEVRDQIQALYDVGITSWMLWAPSNRYTEAALERVQ
tara:strand:- start:17320 stop:18564 length:1245 start_codon:yes stop_codon:yes gene_type:complete